MKLTIDELEHIFDLTIEYYKQRDIRKISFPSHDYYPRVLFKNLDFDNPEFLKCPHIGLGSLMDDLEAWKNILSDIDRLPCMVDVDSLGAILTAFAQVAYTNEQPSTRKIPMPTLTIGELEEIFVILIRYLKQWSYEEISFNDPRYIKISLKNEYIYLDCPPYTIGSLDNCIQAWKKILAGKSKSSMNDIEMLGDILTGIAQNAFYHACH